jgi:Tfp pilus assembly protein PilX
MSMLLTRLFLMLVMKPRPARRERGDVPGWVLITVMTAGLVVAIWGIAGQQLADMLQRALDSVANK